MDHGLPLRLAEDPKQKCGQVRPGPVRRLELALSCKARKGGATLLLLARPPGDAWIVDNELVFVELDVGGEAPGAEADQPVALP